MADTTIELLDSSWDYEDGFLGKLRQGEFDKKLYLAFLVLLRGISFGDDELIPKRVVSLLWYIPLFMEWQKEQITKSIEEMEYNRFKTEIENQLERILGVP